MTDLFERQDPEHVANVWTRREDGTLYLPAFTCRCRLCCPAKRPGRRLVKLPPQSQSFRRLGTPVEPRQGVLEYQQLQQVEFDFEG